MVYLDGDIDENNTIDLNDLVYLKSYASGTEGYSVDANKIYNIATQKQDKQFEFQQELINFSGLISLIDIKKISKELGINYEQLQKDMNSEETILLINESYRLADLIGVRGTPAFIINNNLIPGAIGKNEMLRFLNK